MQVLMTNRNHHVYIITCSDNTLYTGYTKGSIQDRIEQHNAGNAAKYTRGRTPVTLMYSESYATKSAAMSREYEIKQLTRNQKEELIH